MALDIELKTNNNSKCQTKDTAFNAKQKKDMTTLNVELDKEWWLWTPNWNIDDSKYQTEGAALNAKRKNAALNAKQKMWWLWMSN